VRVVPDAHTAQAMITTDLENNQITAFHPGAMMESHLNRADEVPGVKLGIVAPDGFDGMVQHADNSPRPASRSSSIRVRACRCSTVRRCAASLNSRPSSRSTTTRASSSVTRRVVEEIASRVQALIVTRGEHGATILHKNGEEQIRVVQAERIVDPTGCGDAFRGGLLYGIENGLDWATTGRLASLMGSIKIAHQGPRLTH
jgi:adenosine kinase